jgi:hypothetical protein
LFFLERGACKMEWIESAAEWFRSHQALLWWLFAATVAMLVLTPAAVAWLVARMPADHFCNRRRRESPWWQRHHVLGPLTFIVRNVIGAALLLAGLVMLFMPGQGLLTIAAGLVLIDFPGKRRLERWLATRPPVWRSLNWLRQKAGRQPLTRPDHVK